MRREGSPETSSQTFVSFEVNAEHHCGVVDSSRVWQRFNPFENCRLSSPQFPSQFPWLDELNEAAAASLILPPVHVTTKRKGN